MVLWQYSDRGSVSGIAGHVDLNEMISYTNVQSEEPKSESSESESNEKVSDTKMQTIRQGSTGKAVKIWQIIIGVEADGKFGPKTLNATRTFQANNGLDVDGIVGPKTWKKGLESVG
ncbi:MAG: peptidoglycan-binding protein [Lachnospiraceae bacterium]|nr:peptidoglycan-binding protein [Lachnospiraceae bacterium]